MISKALFVSLAVLLSTSPSADPASVSPAESRISAARAAIDSSPSVSRGYSDLALALARRARETSDPSYYRQAEEALERALAISPGDFEARKVQAWVRLGQHRFADAHALARDLNQQAPDDVMVYGLLTDASVELGRYDEAEKAAQWMLDIRPGNVPGLTRAAYLRELFGDLEGARELMQMALDQTPASETEDRAWILTQIGHLHLLEGDTARAERVLRQALDAFPGYHYALGNLARVRTAQGRYAEAASLLRERQAAADHPENRYELAEALERAGEKKEARAVFAEFEKAARAESDGPDNANRELIFYYTDHARKPDEALRIASAEAAGRQDVYTLDAYAWALWAKGRRGEARDTLRKALAVGVRDPRVLDHARVMGVRRPDANVASLTVLSAGAAPSSPGRTGWARRRPPSPPRTPPSSPPPTGSERP
jgi:tetratricopeptide (TPR) repeat protein